MSKGQILVNSKSGTTKEFAVGVRIRTDKKEEILDFIGMMIDNGFDFDGARGIQNDKEYACASVKGAKPKDLSKLLLKLEELGFEY